MLNFKRANIQYYFCI